MIDYKDIKEVNAQLKASQEAETDNREFAREAHDFLDKRDGQWEPQIIQRMSGRPRYTFDKCNPVVDGIAGEMEGADFDIKVRPIGGGASKELSAKYDGLIRNIEAISNSTHVYNQAGREMVAAGIGGWEIVVDYVDGDSFDQDFMIKWIPGFEDRVWFDSGAIQQDMRDARFVFVLEDITPDEYEERFPDGSKMSIGDDKPWSSYENKPEFITVGRVIYKDDEMKEIAQMSDGSVYEVNDEYDKVVDELAEQGITEKRRKNKKGVRVYSRLFDASDFLTDPELTVFKSLPIIPTYGNFKVREGKVIYRGAIEKLMDAQRAYNYTRSREIEDVALSPPDVTWASRKQLSNPNDRMAAENMSVSPQRVYLFTPDMENPGPPIRTGGPSISPGLQQATQNSLDDISTSSARAPLQNGDIDKTLSGVAIDALNSRSDTGTIKYFKAQEIAICATARVLIESIPLLYDSTAQKRIINEDGSYELIDINKTVMDMQTRTEVKLNDLSQGKYDVVCDVGPAFKNRQQETVAALNELSRVIPGLAEITADIQLKNIAAPGVDLAAERVRRQLLQSGVIPPSQMTEEEKNEMQQAQTQEKEPSAQDKIANAEIARVQAETQDVMARAQLKQEELRIKEQKDLLDAQNKSEKLQMEELSLMMKQQSEQVKQQNAVIEAGMKGQMQVFEMLKVQADTLNALKTAMGADAIVSPELVETYSQQVDIIDDTQDKAEDLSKL